MESDLPAIDALLDQAVCLVREVQATSDRQDIENFLAALIIKHPQYALLGAAYHLGMLTMTRYNCERSENES